MTIETLPGWAVVLVGLAYLIGGWVLLMICLWPLLWLMSKV